ncbi:hypothetical protein LXL04_007594 [Taraxacum kok-saghyz]
MSSFSMKLDNQTLFNLANWIGSSSEVQTLFPDDYEIWALYMEDYLLGLENGYMIWKSVTKGPHKFPLTDESDSISVYTNEEYEELKTTPGITISKENKERIEIDLKAKRELRFALTPNVFRLVRNCNSANALWKKLEEMYGGNKKQLKSQQTGILTKLHRCMVQGLFTDNLYKSYSIKYCTFRNRGTHISNTREAKAFALLSEEGIAKGIRRVTAVTTDYAFEAIKKAAELEEEVNQASKLEGNALEQKVTSLNGQVESAAIPSAKKADLKAKISILQSYQRWIYHGEVVPPVVVPPVVDEVASTTYEMADVLNDLVGEQNTNDDSDEGNLDDGGTTVDEEFAELFEEMNTELYPGCTWLSSLTSTANLLHMKAMNKWTHSSFDQLMKFLKFVFPKDNKIPSSYYEAKKKMRKMGLGLRRMYSSRHTAKEMTWHKTGRSEEGKMRHPVDGTAWKDFDARYPDFAKEPRNIRLALAADGFNPFGPRSPGKDMDVFLRPLVDELKVLWDEGVKVRDVATNTVFTMHAALLWTINDFPARSSLSGWSGQGYKACPTCNEDTPSCRVKRKTAYVGHRRFLPTKHHWRSSRLFNGKSERRGPPKRFSPTTILRQLSYVQIRKPGKHPRVGGVKRPRDLKELNWSKKSIFYELKYWSSLPLKHNLDVMHIEKNVCDSLLGTLLMNKNSKDTTYARDDLKDLGIRKEDWLQESDNKTTKPHPKYSFTVENRKKFCQFIKGVKLPDGFGSNFKRKVNENCTNIIGLKSHDCHILMQRLLPIGVRGRGYLDKNIATTICELCTFFKQICARTLDMNPETRQIQGAIDNWHDNHYKEIGGWPNKAAKLAYEKLVAEREKEVQSQQASSSSSSNAITVNEREIFQKVIGERRGHTVGIGRKLKRPSGLPSSSTTSAPVSYETMQKTIHEVVRVTQEASDRHHEEQSRKWSEDFISQLAQMIPNVNFATFRPFESTPAPPFDYNAFMGSTNEVSQQQSEDDDEEECTNENDYVFGVLKTHEDDVVEVEKTTPGGINALLFKSEKKVKFTSPVQSSESEESDDEADEKALMANAQKKFYKNKYNSGSKYNKFAKYNGSSEKKREEGGGSEEKKELTGDSGYDCNYCNRKNHLAKDCMLNRKKERENVTKDEAYYVTKLKNFRNLNVKGVNLLVAKEADEGMEIWSSGSEDEEMMRPTHGAMFARDANHARVSMKALTKAYTTSKYNTAKNIIEFELEEGIRTTISKSSFTKLLYLSTDPALMDPDQISSSDMITTFNQMGHTPILTRLSAFKKNKLPSLWSCMFTILFKCLAERQTGTDSASKQFLTLLHALFNDLPIDLGKILWTQFCESPTSATKDTEISMARFWSLVVHHAQRHYHIVQSAPITEDTIAKFPELQIGKLTIKSDDFCEFVGKIPEEMLNKLDQESDLCKAYKLANPLPYLLRNIPENIQQFIEKQKVVPRTQGKRKGTPVGEASSPKPKKQKKKSKRSKPSTLLRDDDSETESDPNIRQTQGTQSSPHTSPTSEPLTIEPISTSVT